MIPLPYGLMADVHAHNWSAFAETRPDGTNSRLAGLLDEIERCAKEVHAAGGTDVVIAGDLFHVRGAVAPSVLNPLRDRLARCVSDYGVSFHILAGNHDLEGRDSTRLSSAVTALEGEFIHTIDQPSRAGNVVFVPWIERIEDLKKTLADCELDKDTDLIIHAPIDGVIEGLPLHGLQPEFLASLGARRVFAGHYHNHKLMMYDSLGGDKSHACSVYSIGALAHHSWSDVGSKAGFLLVHGDRVEWRKSHLPEFIDMDRVAAYAEPEDIALIVDGNYVRVKVDADKAKEVEAARRELLDMGARAVLVQAQPKAPVREGGSKPATTSAGVALEVSVTEFAKGLASKGGIDPDVLARAALDVLTAASGKGD